jgi:transketolase
MRLRHAVLGLAVIVVAGAAGVGCWYRGYLAGVLPSAAAAKTKRVVTIDDHSIHGGHGGAVAETLAEVMPTPLKRLGVTGFGESGDPKGLYAKHGLDPAGLAASITKFLHR